MRTGIKFCFGFMLLVVIATGVIVLKNWEKLFGRHPDLEHESTGAATYSKMQFIVVWAIAIKVLALMIFWH